MILKVKPVSRLYTSLKLPTSKSYSIRSFMVALRGGCSRIVNPSKCDDALTALSVARQLGAKVTQKNNGTCYVQAHARKIKTAKINVHESGTVLRFLLPLLSDAGRTVRIVGEKTLKGRPNHHLTRALRGQGMKIKGTGSKESVPIIYKGGSLKGGTIAIDGSVSSQFISALLIAAPTLQTDTKIVIKGKRVVSAEYVLMTQQILKQAGIKTQRVDNRTLKVRGRQTFKGLKNFKTPADLGLAAYWLAAGAMIDSKLTLKGHMAANLTQADANILNLLRKMGARFKKTPTAITINGPFQLKGGSFSLEESPDLVPIMAVLALFAKGKTRLYNISHARVKESDRIGDLKRELLKVGAKITDKKGEMTIYPQKQYKGNVLLNPHHDHRLAMAFTVLGLKVGARIKDIECTSKSYGGFVRDLRLIT